MKSALPSSRAMRLCPNLLILPPDMKKYVAVSKVIREIFSRFTEIYEPLSLDEAFLDVTGSTDFQGSAFLIAKEIRKLIFKETSLTASAGISHNKFLAKVASDWEKPDGQFLISPDMVEGFMPPLPVRKIFGVGRVTAEKMGEMGIHTCGDLQKLSVEKLVLKFGGFGRELYRLCRGDDDRPVVTSRVRKSLSVERTFSSDLAGEEELLGKLPGLYFEFRERLSRHIEKRGASPLKTMFVKIRFSDFSSTTVERPVAPDMRAESFIPLFREGYERAGMPVRLIGLGVKFAGSPSSRSISAEGSRQLAFF